MRLWPGQLPVTQNEAVTITCYDDLGNPKTHGLEQRYVSPTSGICRKLVVQAVSPFGKLEVPISNHTNQASKIAIWLLSNSPIRGWIIFKWIGVWLLFTLKLLWSVIWLLAQLFAPIDLADDTGEDTDLYNTGYYKPYVRGFQGQLWAARSPMEHSSRIIEEGEMDIPTHTLYPRVLIIRDPICNEWVSCADRDTIIRTKFIAISYRAVDAFTRGPDQEIEKAQFIEEVRATVLEQKYDAYWLDLECVGETPSEKNRDLYCMADVYRGAAITLIMLGKSASGEKECWKGWGERVWTMPEALLSSRLCYKFRDRETVTPLSLFELANLAYTNYDIEQAIVNAYSGKDPLERLERLTLLKSAIWRRGTAALAPGVTPPPPKLDMIGDSEKSVTVLSGAYKAERVYALMGFFEHRIQPNRSEDDLRALVRLSMANDNDRIAERMVSMLPSTITKTACWYSDDDIYRANLWDILPEIQVAGVTDNGALVVDGCRSASIRWKDFPEVAFETTDSLRRTIIGFIPYLSWPTLIIGLAILMINRVGGIALTVIGLVLLIVSPRLFVFSQSGRIVSAQPWLIGVKGVVSIKEVESHLYGGAARGHFPRMYFTPSGSQFSIPERGLDRGGSFRQYDYAKLADSGPDAGHIYTLIDTCSSTMYYFRAQRPPTVCIYAGREGGLGRFVLCSEKCDINELHKESVLRMPTEISEKMELCGWVALG
ncbi:uncharacterized protein F5891DRAFT_1011047 [Suillus fuscotomentosus]|uniref:Heterokaryon incompatibility domain-containing protein n=1 Tax=Suillus fuscotomentosus TaxID=1912939 RepID=A0AAD4HPB9_9AGAM|nr:uncharacterized protein F5891DRAFT_1011047 [Suillus fuscotomentosus]KAG1905130.1 hypothetical protein F5891DRAFT_1011047 [Suillus fuscotomentosus]